MKLHDAVGKNGILTGDTFVEQLAWEIAGLYKFNS